MGFSRSIQPAIVLNGEPLTRSMVGIGMNFAARGDPHANIEDTLFFASVEGMSRDDLRVLAMLVTWLDVHSPWVNADRLTRIVTECTSERVRAFWASFAKHHATDSRFKRLANLQCAPIDLLATGTEFQIRRHGEDPRFKDGPLRVPSNVLRDRAADVLEPALLAKRHAAYRWRRIIGPTYRADMWALLYTEPSMGAADLARRTYGSFATAWAVKRDLEAVGWRALSSLRT